MSSQSLYVIKLGSSTIVHHPEVFAELNDLVQKGKKVLLVAGGAEGIRQKYEQLNRSIPVLALANGDEARYCSPSEMPLIRAAYQEFILAKVHEQLKSYQLKVFAQIGGDNEVVFGQKSKPIKAIVDGKTVIVRDSLFGSFTGCNVDFLQGALQVFDVVCLTPPIYDRELGEYINIDADMLAAHLATELAAEHLRFVTGTAGLLRNVDEPASTISDVYLGDEIHSIKGRMKQKVRAANHAISKGICDVSITGPHSLNRPGTGKTWFWNMQRDASGTDLLRKAIRIPSVSGDESVLAGYLLNAVQLPGVNGFVDEAGNVVFRKGNGPNQLLLLGHLDTVPYNWQVACDEERIAGRGTVDAKGSLLSFIQMLYDAEVPEDGSLLVIGAVEEEVSSSKGAFYVRDHYRADAVIIGEPSGEDSLTLGYYGLYKLSISISKPQEHSAGKDSISVLDQLYTIVADIRERVGSVDPSSLSSLIDIKHSNHKGILSATGILNFRISPLAGKDYAKQIQLDYGDGVSVTVLRATPGFANPRNSPLVKAFVRSFASKGKAIHYIKKRGTSDMNTLATTWEGVPMVAYGPGDASLDHTNEEYLQLSEVHGARAILQGAIEEWYRLRSEEGSYGYVGTVAKSFS
ncbi:acetylornithine deacetylase [Paenibacillus algorifonticola]|uniref:Acetylornithine deacetylase n=1 Tax=Paenibacillus algorifonticola TaxID=684063 RepID=A0A1I1Y268_9BACL|nr:M20/M25/M40 family metallo-hydrolase [Paenibacillus algorifonticola]SFE13499.1 acetylornithine deacetylase [Paenibacillus algorifonticola]